MSASRTQYAEDDMGDGEGKPVRRLRLVSPRRPAAPAQPPRVEALDALLREVDDLRLTLETDLTLAASAVESGAPEMAAEILSNDQDALHRFEERALDRLAELDVPSTRRKSVWAQAHAAPIVAAAALVGVLVGVVPHLAGPTDGPANTVAATDSLQRVQELAEQGDTEELRAASAALHRQLAGVVANAGSDPAAAQTALLILTYEQSAIVRSGDSQALADVLRQSQALARAIVAAMPKSARSAVPSLRPVNVDGESPSPTAKPKPSASPSASPKPKPSAGSSPKASPSPSKSDGYPLPSPPVAP